MSARVSRQPAGTSKGGQFAPHQHADPEGSLPDDGRLEDDPSVKAAGYLSGPALAEAANNAKALVDDDRDDDQV